MFKNLLRILKRSLGWPKKKKYKKRKFHKKSTKRFPKRRLKQQVRKRLNRRKTKKRPIVVSKKKKLSKTKKKAGVVQECLGEITHYFPKVKAAVVKMKKPLNIGEPVRIKGKVTDFRQTVGSMQINRKPIDKARAGQEIGLEVLKAVRPGDMIYTSEKNSKR